MTPPATPFLQLFSQDRRQGRRYAQGRQMVATGARAGRHVPDAHATKRKHQVSCLRPSMSVEAYTLKRPELLLQTQEASPEAWSWGTPCFYWGKFGEGILPRIYRYAESQGTYFPRYWGLNWPPPHHWPQLTRRSPNLPCDCMWREGL